MSTPLTKDELKDSLDMAVALTFGDMSFLDVQPALEEEQSAQEGQLLHISFLAPATGGMMLFLPLELKRQIVENIHAKPWDELNNTEIDDCLLELLNVLAGNFLQQMFGSDTKVNLSFPEVLFDRFEVEHVGSYHDFFYNAEGIPLVVSIRLVKMSGDEV
jgi:CheY-specific phosphatase CheX